MVPIPAQRYAFPRWQNVSHSRLWGTSETSTLTLLALTGLIPHLHVGSRLAYLGSLALPW